MEPRVSTRLHSPTLRTALCAAGLLFAGASALAQEQALPRVKLPASAATPRGPVLPRDRMYYLTPGDGSLWARGADYKASFAAGGTQFIPFLGADAPRSFPVTVRVESVSVGGREIAFDAEVGAARDGDRVTYPRGSFDEVYDLRPDSMEQLFVFEDLPVRGEIVVRISTESELLLRAAESAADQGSGQAIGDAGLEFANELGAVRYSRATALDASGASAAAPTSIVDGGIEIRVPADFVAAAAMPLVIDPLFLTFSIDTSTKDDFFPDVAYDSGNDRFLVVYEEIWNSIDRDIPYKLLSSTGAFIAGGYIDFTSVYWASPAVANVSSADQFMCVAAVGIPGNGPRGIYANAVAASNGGVGLQIPVSTADETGDKFAPDIGGNPNPNGPTYYLAVWQRALTSSDHDIHGRLIHPDGSLIGASTMLISNSAASVDEVPSVSKSNDSTTWNLVWHRNFGSASTILGARINWEGSWNAFPIVIDNQPSTILSHPTASSSLAGTSRWIVAYEHLFSGGRDIDLRFMDGLTTLDLVNMTGLEAFAGQDRVGEEQVQPTADCDGKSFAVAYAESFNNSPNDYDVYVSTLTPVGNRILMSEPQVNLAFNATYEADPAIAACGSSGGGQRRYMAVWEDLVDPSTHADIEGALYDGGQFTSFCSPLYDAAIACPCGNPASSWGRGCNNSTGTGGAMLTASGLAYLSVDTMVLTSTGELPNALTVFAQGNVTLASGVVFGQGVRCVGGTIKRLYSKNAVNGMAMAPQSGDLSIHARSAALGHVIGAGQSRGYYAFYRDPVVLGGCPGTSRFNSTQAVLAVWMP